MRTLAVAVCLCAGVAAVRAADVRLGIVGADTSHATAFTKILNDDTSPEHVPGARVVAAYSGGSPDIESSRNRVAEYTAELRDKWHVQIAATIPELCSQVDAVLLTSIDGRTHLEQARQIIAAHKPVFIDKPFTSTLEDARAIAALAQQAGVPWFSSSSLRFDGVAALRTPDLNGASTWGPGPLEEHHYLDLAWYAIHPIEMLYTLMGEGCQTVTRISSPDTDVVVGQWKDGRIGTVRALRPYSKYGAVVFRKGAKEQSFEIAGEPVGGYVPLLREIVRFFQTGKPPVANSETLEIFAFLDAAQRSKAAGGKPQPLR